ncbi:MAG: flavin reductase family protein [Thermomicrobiales bacterium]
MVIAMEQRRSAMLISGAQDWSMTLDRDLFTDAMSRAVTGVTVVTSEGESGRFGQTVSAMSSVSAEPPSLLICINRRSPMCSAIERHRVFAVNVLRADQRRIAETFAGRPRSGLPYDFAGARWEADVTGSPLLVGAVARFDCGLEAAITVGTHEIFVGHVVGASANPGTPLVYARRGYGELHSFPNRPAVPVRPGGDFEFEVETDLDLGEL